MKILRDAVVMEWVACKYTSKTFVHLSQTLYSNKMFEIHIILFYSILNICYLILIRNNICKYISLKLLFNAYTAWEL